MLPALDDDVDASDLDEGDDSKIICGVKVKSQYGIGQWMTIPLLSLSITIVGVYMNAQLAFMLADENMFNIAEDRIGRATSELLYYTVPFSLLSSTIASYAYEILGRNLVLTVSYLLTGVVYVWMPYTAPNYTWLIVSRCCIAFTFAPPISHPLVNDYIVKKYRGRAASLNGMGVIIGELFSMGVLLKFTEDMTYYDAFVIVAFVIWAFTLYFYCYVVDVDLGAAVA